MLVVDDDDQVRTYLRRCLAPLTSRVLEAADGREALDVARAAAPEALQLVITDVVMPRMDGLELRAAMETTPGLDQVPVLFITGADLAVPEGTVLHKPFNARKLLAAVRSMLDGAP